MAVIAFVWNWYNQPRSIEEMAKNLEVDVDQELLTYGDVSYEADWSYDQSIYSGDIRFVHRADLPGLPIVTHEVIITTGEYSDPEFVSITPIKNGTMRWSAPSRPETGSLDVLHFIPINKSVLQSLDEIEEGDVITVYGYTEEDRIIRGSDGSMGGLRHDGHEFILVEKISWHGDDEE